MFTFLRRLCTDFASGVRLVRRTADAPPERLPAEFWTAVSRRLAEAPPDTASARRWRAELADALRALDPTEGPELRAKAAPALGTPRCGFRLPGAISSSGQ